MVLLTAVAVLAVATAVVYRLIRKQPDRRSLWRVALIVGLGTGVVRALLASAGWYIVERGGGALQIPAFALAMMAWPEAALFTGRRVAPAPPAFYLELALLLVATTLAFACLVALVAAKSGFGRARR